MYILGDIGNTETKFFLVTPKYEIIKKLTYSTKNLNEARLNILFVNLKINYKKLSKILFCR